MDRDTLLRLAERLGVKGEGLSDGELVREIVKRAREKNLI